MNWGFIQWFGGVLVTLVLLRVLWRVFRRFTSKETIDKGINRLGSKIDETTDNFTNYVQNKVDRHRAKKQEEKNRRPEIIIR